MLVFAPRRRLPFSRQGTYYCRDWNSLFFVYFHAKNIFEFLREGITRTVGFFTKGLFNRSKRVYNYLTLNFIGKIESHRILT